MISTSDCGCSSDPKSIPQLTTPVLTVHAFLFNSMFEQTTPSKNAIFLNEAVPACLASIENQLNRIKSSAVSDPALTRAVDLYASTFLDLIMTNKLITEDTLAKFPLVSASRNRIKVNPSIAFTNK